MRSLLLFFSVLFVSATCFSQATTVFDMPALPATVASPSFSDPLRYNSYDFCGSPVGFFDRDTLRLRLDLSAHLIRWHSAERNDSLVQRYTAWNLPDLLIGVPNIFYVRLFYSPTTIVADVPGMVTAQRTSFPLQAFGLTLACQVPSGLFQFAFQGKGYYGDASTESNQDTRLIMGLDDLSLTVGSRIHEMVAIGMQGGVSARFDSLRDMSFPADYERSFEGRIPALGWFIDFGTAGFPVQSTISLNTAACRQVYFSGFDRDPIKGDSIAWKWQTAGDLSSGGRVYHPSLLLGYWRNHYQRFAPTEENDDLTVGPLREGWDWNFSNFYFGIGASADILGIGSAWVEFTRSTLGLEYGEYWRLSSQTDKNHSYYSTNVGIEAQIHEISALKFPSSIQTFLRIGFFNRTQNSGIDPFQSREFGKIIQVPSGSRDYRYRPDNGFGWGPTERITGLVFGLGNSFLNGMIESDAHMSFFGRSLHRNQNGFAFGIDLAYALEP